MNHGHIPGAEGGRAGCGWRFQVESRTAGAGARAAGCAIQSAVPAKGQAAVRAAAVVFAGEQVKRSEEPAGVGALQLEDGAAAIRIAVAALDRAFRRGSVKVPGSIQGESGVGSAAVGSAGKVVQDGVGLRVQLSCGDDHQQRQCECGNRHPGIDPRRPAPISLWKVHTGLLERKQVYVSLFELPHCGMSTTDNWPDTDHCLTA